MLMITACQRADIVAIFAIDTLPLMLCHAAAAAISPCAPPLFLMFR